MAINIRRWLCSLTSKGRWLYKICDCQRYEQTEPDIPALIDVLVCDSTGLLVNDYCPIKTLRTYIKGQEPNTVCTAHTKPIDGGGEEETRIKVCRDTGARAIRGCPNIKDVPATEAPQHYCRRHARRTKGLPLFVLCWFDLPNKVHRFTDEQLDAWARRVGEAGVDLVRMAYYDDGGDCVFPFKKKGDLWNLADPDTRWDDGLERIAIALGRYEVGTLVEPCDHCSHGHKWDWWSCNTAGIKNLYDSSAACLTIWKGLVRRIMAATGGPEGQAIGLGNELCHPSSDRVYLRQWAQDWGIPRVKFLQSLGYAEPYFVSASGFENGMTGQKLMSYLNGEDDVFPGRRHVCGVIHGAGLSPDHVPPPDAFNPGDTPPATQGAWLRDFFSVERLWGSSDDGISCNGWCYVPPGPRAGTCDKKKRYAAATGEKVKWIRALREAWGDRLSQVEFMPREISYDEPPARLAQENLDCYEAIAKALWGKSVKRLLD